VAQLQPDAQTRLVELADLVAAVLFLASDEAQGVSGQILPVTGKDV
jgi:NAD(P)-dependent dehydrogenase (short-subunit alcohol dehydrogenase family)